MSRVLFFPGSMERISVLGKLRMRQYIINRAVPLDVVPERRTKRCSPRFRPGDRFCKLSFRCMSPCSEGEKCRPLDHLWQIPFIHSTRFITCNNSIYIAQRSSFYFHVVYSSMSWYGAYLTIAHALFKKHSSLRFRATFRAIIQIMSFSIWNVLEHTHAHLQKCWGRKANTD